MGSSLWTVRSGIRTPHPLPLLRAATVNALAAVMTDERDRRLPGHVQRPFYAIQRNGYRRIEENAELKSSAAAGGWRWKIGRRSRRTTRHGRCVLGH